MIQDRFITRLLEANVSEYRLVVLIATKSVLGASGQVTRHEAEARLEHLASNRNAALVRYRVHDADGSRRMQDSIDR